MFLLMWRRDYGGDTVLDVLLNVANNWTLKEQPELCKQGGCLVIIYEDAHGYSIVEIQCDVRYCAVL